MFKGGPLQRIISEDKTLEEEFEKLNDKEKAKILQLLEGSGCEILIN